MVGHAYAAANAETVTAVAWQFLQVKRLAAAPAIHRLLALSDAVAEGRWLTGPSVFAWEPPRGTGEISQ